MTWRRIVMWMWVEILVIQAVLWGLILGLGARSERRRERHRRYMEENFVSDYAHEFEDRR